VIEQISVNEEIDRALLGWSLAHHGVLHDPCARLMRRQLLGKLFGD
jgi:hypothetical protein